MEQIERIKQMERHLERAQHAVRNLVKALDEYNAAEEGLNELKAYYDSEAWKQDFTDDEAGRLPKELKRGVLSEDAIWNLLEETDEIEKRMSKIRPTERQPEYKNAKCHETN